MTLEFEFKDIGVKSKHSWTSMYKCVNGQKIGGWNVPHPLLYYKQFDNNRWNLK